MPKRQLEFASLETHVPWISVQEGDDLMISFASGDHTGSSIDLRRSPKYEDLLPVEERGVKVSSEEDLSLGAEMLVSVNWSLPLITLISTRHRYLLEVRSVDPHEIAEALTTLKRMHFDNGFHLTFV